MRDDDFIAPELPADIAPEDLDIGARAQLKTLTKENAEFVAKHLAAAAQLIDDDPQLAHQHALAAARRAGRIGVVRESLAITAYTLGDFALALRELRTYRRITGRDDQLPLMADCERGLGRPEKALELARSVDASTLETPVRVELAIVKSGARLDLGQKEAALEELRIPELQKDKAFEYSPALFASFAGVLEELGRDEEAAEWYALADRAIDALEAALAPGELESIGITTERIESEDVDQDGLPLEPTEIDAPSVPADDPASDDPAADESVESPAAGAPADAIVDAGSRDVTAGEGAEDAPADAAPADAVPGEDEADAVALAAAAPAAEPAPVADVEQPEAAVGETVEPTAPAADDALFGDALFGDELIENEGGSPRAGDER
ncbi:tetratricopeptide repeat protein [Agrococcus carbonis]|uniref:TPR-repeat-containing protein n=1 Tax=Agrococcus carbonis TaxID=684552 RepID=A0A1H1SMP2_9MICO|nr:hypothetical protein [Agrococcus carbonis]SDS49280.1 hypothetical protein SAMN04489719_2448 [Agrococcus carbonis]